MSGTVSGWTGYRLPAGGCPPGGPAIVPGPRRRRARHAGALAARVLSRSVGSPVNGRCPDMVGDQTGPAPAGRGRLRRRTGPAGRARNTPRGHMSPVGRHMIRGLCSGRAGLPVAAFPGRRVYRASLLRPGRNTVCQLRPPWCSPAVVRPGPAKARRISPAAVGRAGADGIGVRYYPHSAPGITENSV